MNAGVGPTSEQLAEWRRVTDAATPGPWCYYGEDLWRGTVEELAAYDADPENAPDPFGDAPWPDSLAHIFHGDPVYPRDAEFVAAAREAVPVLLAEVEQLRQELALSEGEREDLDTGTMQLLGEHVEVEAERDELAAAVSRVERLCREWDQLSKGETVTTAAIRAALAGAS